MMIRFEDDKCFYFWDHVGVGCLGLVEVKVELGVVVEVGRVRQAATPHAGYGDLAFVLEVEGRPLGVEGAVAHHPNVKEQVFFPQMLVKHEIYCCLLIIIVFGW